MNDITRESTPVFEKKGNCPYLAARLMKQLREFTNEYAFKYKDCKSLGGCHNCPYELYEKDYSSLDEEEKKKWIDLFDSLSITPENLLHQELDDAKKLELLAKYLDENRTPLHKEEERVIYTEAFRRLQYKTQVMINSASDDQRTRLLHSLEVQKISRKLAVALRANYELAETIAVAHDIGHTPFGHAGERVIKHYLENEMVGSFSHALQGVKVADFLCSHRALKPMGLKGLGLSDYVLEGILKHDSDSFIDKIASAAYRLQYECSRLYKPVGVDDQKYKNNQVYIGGIETQIVCWADKIAYMSHDWEEFVDVGLLEIMISRINVMLIKLDEYIQNPLNIQYKYISAIESDSLKKINSVFNKLKETFYPQNYSKKFQSSNDTFVSTLYKFIKVFEEIIILQELHPTSFVFFSNEQYKLWHSFCKIAWAWIRVTGRIPEAVGGKVDIMFVLYKYLCDTTAHRTVPALINLLISCCKNKLKLFCREDMGREEFIKLCNDKWSNNLQDIVGLKQSNILSSKRSKVKNALKNSFIVSFDDNCAEAVNYISTFIHEEFIGSTRVKFMTHKAEITIEKLLTFYYENPHMLPLKYRNRISLESNMPETIIQTTKLLKEYYSDRINNALFEDEALGIDNHSNFNQTQKVIARKVKILIGIDLAKYSACEHEKMIADITKVLESCNVFAVDAIKLRTISDYISGMTDRMAEKKYNEICSSSTQWSKAYTERGTFNI